MQWEHINILVIICSGFSMVGCQRASDPGVVPGEAVPPPVVQAPPRIEPDLTRAPSVPEGWKLYTAPEGDFSVIVPGDPTEAGNQDTKIGKIRRYGFQKDGTLLALELYAEKPEPFATNTVEELRDSSDIIPGTLRDVSLPGMPGIEFRTMGGAGEVIHREFCSPDRSRSITMFVQKSVGHGLSEAEVRTFLDSFKFLPRGGTSDGS